MDCLGAPSAELSYVTCMTNAPTFLFSDMRVGSTEFTKNWIILE